MNWFNDPLNAQGAEDPLDTPGLWLDNFAVFPFALVANPQSFSHAGGPFALNDDGLFSMTLQFSGSLAEGVSLTGLEMMELKPLVAVPNPASLLLLGAGLLGAALPGLRRFRAP